MLTETNSPLSREQAEQLSRLVADLRNDQLNWLSGYLAGLSAAGAGFDRRGAGRSPRGHRARGLANG
ncbi:MAG: hypothetical protein BRD57_05870 [Proteobacteria bacterium SW_6_67_9]|nr:MAG: hypothetical protein BRD57_05870 [Proteobacteria bacterium SW_6_67_9]